jgi:hypothetical protein
MKKTVFITLFSISLLALKASAQDTTSTQSTQSTDSIQAFSIADSTIFTGKYKYENLPFEYMEITVKDGKLFYSGGEYSGPLDAIKDKKDAFDANGNAVFTFIRSTDSTAAQLQIDYQGQTFTGKKE